MGSLLLVIISQFVWDDCADETFMVAAIAIYSLGALAGVMDLLSVPAALIQLSVSGTGALVLNIVSATHWGDDTCPTHRWMSLHLFCGLAVATLTIVIALCTGTVLACAFCAKAHSHSSKRVPATTAVVAVRMSSQRAWVV